MSDDCTHLYSSSLYVSNKLIIKSHSLNVMSLLSGLNILSDI
jgi:hypothetical protein